MTPQLAAGFMAGLANGSARHFCDAVARGIVSVRFPPYRLEAADAASIYRIRQENAAQSGLKSAGLPEAIESLDALPEHQIVVIAPFESQEGFFELFLSEATMALACIWIAPRATPYPDPKSQGLA